MLWGCIETRGRVVKSAALKSNLPVCSQGSHNIQLVGVTRSWAALFPQYSLEYYALPIVGRVRVSPGPDTHFINKTRQCKSLLSIYGILAFFMVHLAGLAKCCVFIVLFAVGDTFT